MFKNNVVLKKMLGGENWTRCTFFVPSPCFPPPQNADSSIRNLNLTAFRLASIDRKTLEVNWLYHHSSGRGRVSE